MQAQAALASLTANHSKNSRQWNQERGLASFCKLVSWASVQFLCAEFSALCAFAFCAFWLDCHCYAWFLGHPDRGGARRLCCHRRRLECALAWYSSSIEWAGEDFSVAATCASTWSYILAEITWMMLLLCLRTYGFKVCSPGMPRELDACAGHDKCGSVPITRTSDYGDMVMELSFGLFCRICRMGGGSWCTDSRIYACDLQKARHRRAWPGPTWPAFMIWAHAQCKVISGIVDLKIYSSN